ncbi:thiamine phosphate synthase [Tardiphaga sp.]|uniref:thiamine phosphate synthase n=1 Tax=Tardiphaga sp. TaxID=1926292 RepID=UPI00262E2B9F|nr:thiamine phosphate synthase [Tardiphaga sp.]
MDGGSRNPEGGIVLAKPVPPPPAPRLYLATPVLEDPAALVTELPALLAKADVAAVLVRLKMTDQRTLISRIKALVPAIQPSGAAVLIEGHAELVARGGADGAHLDGIEAVEDAMETLKPDWIAGVGGLSTRHDSMAAGEAGVDYVLFGEPDAKGERPSADAIAERLQWWAELFEPPCVGYAASVDEARAFAVAGADFVLVGDFIWADPRGPTAALMDAEQAIGLGHAARLEVAKSEAAMPGTAKAEQE